MHDYDGQYQTNINRAPFKMLNSFIIKYNRKIAKAIYSKWEEVLCS